MTELAVAYRIYPGAKSPAFFPNDKLNLSSVCLRSFRRALGNLRIKIWAILDGCPPEYETLFQDVLGDYDLQIVKQDKIGNQKTFSLQMDLPQRKMTPQILSRRTDCISIMDCSYYPQPSSSAQWSQAS